jgi:hypothetical protein
MKNVYFSIGTMRGAIFGGLLFGFVTMSFGANTPLVGKWRGVPPTNDSLEFTEQGIINAEKYGATMSGKYTVIDNEWIQISFGGLAASTAPLPFRYLLSGDALTISDPRGSSDHYLRLGSTGAAVSRDSPSPSALTPMGTQLPVPRNFVEARARLVGKWIEESDDPRFWSFNEDGTVESMDAGDTGLRHTAQFEMLSPMRMLLEEKGAGLHLLYVRFTEQGVVLADPLNVRLWNFRHGDEADFKKAVATGSVKAQGKAIMNNLRMLAAAADQFYLENGVPEAQLSQLVGPDKYMKRLVGVAGEDYFALKFKQGLALSVTTSDGRVYTYPP